MKKYAASWGQGGSADCCPVVGSDSVERLRMVGGRADVGSCLAPIDGSTDGGMGATVTCNSVGPTSS